MLAFEAIHQHYADYFGEDSTRYGLVPRMITNPDEIRDLTAFFASQLRGSPSGFPDHVRIETSGPEPVVRFLPRHPIPRSPWRRRRSCGGGEPHESSAQS